MKRTPLKKKSTKQKERDDEWAKAKVQRRRHLSHKYEYDICEFCGKVGYVGNTGLYHLGGHHIDRNRSNNTEENCYSCHRICHSYITDNNIAVQQEDFYGKVNKINVWGER